MDKRMSDTKQSPESKYRHVRITRAYHDKLAELARLENRKLIDQMEVLIDRELAAARQRGYTHQTTDRS
jgi:hypothetical protein